MAEQTFTDPLAQEYYREGEMKLESAQSAEAVLRQAEAFGQKEARAEVMQSAFYFLAAAHFLESRDAKESARAYHQAGQQLHRIGSSPRPRAPIQVPDTRPSVRRGWRRPSPHSMTFSTWPSARIHGLIIVSRKWASLNGLKRNI